MMPGSIPGWLSAKNSRGRSGAGAGFPQPTIRIATPTHDILINFIQYLIPYNLRPFGHQTVMTTHRWRRRNRYPSPRQPVLKRELFGRFRWSVRCAADDQE